MYFQFRVNPIDMKLAMSFTCLVNRSYVQTARAAAAEKTRRSILEATVAMVREEGSLAFTLADVAAAAGTSVQTLLRHFGDRQGLFNAAIGYARAQVAAERAVIPGDPGVAITSLFDHYERWGRAMLSLLDLGTEEARAATAQGRELHRAWVRYVFATGHDDAVATAKGESEELTDLLVVATDLYTWRLLVLDIGLARVVAEARVRRLITAILGELE
jgi:AcrR family transcriptional regulator